MLVTSLRRLLASKQGSAIPLVALAIFALTGATGTAIDMGRVQMVQAKLSNALDAAGLAVGSEVSTVNVNTEALKYFNVNFPANFLGSTVHNFTVTATNNNATISLSVQADVPMAFMQMFGISKVTVSAASQITRQSSGMELVLVLDNTGSMNSPVNSSNSNTPKIAALQAAAATLLNTLYGSSNNTVPNLWVGVVPFSQAVNIGTGYSGWMDGSYDSTLDFGPVISGTSCQSAIISGTTYPGVYNSNPGCTYAVSSTTNSSPPAAAFGMSRWQGCVMARSAPYDTSDDVPSTAPFQAYDYPWTPDAGITYDPWKSASTASSQHCTGSGKSKVCTTTYTTTTAYNFAYQSSLPGAYGGNLFCPQPVLPMVAEENTVLNEINSLTAGGSTMIDLGMVWGWRMLSPKWRGLWGGEMNSNNLPLNYNTPLMNKVVILMTDGMNSISSGNFTAYKYLDNALLGTTNQTTADSTLDSRTLAVCNSMKANGIIIYTIGFGSNGDNNPNDPTSVNGPLLQSCASQPSYYFLAPTNAQLQSAFQQIGDSLANLRISQ